MLLFPGEVGFDRQGIVLPVAFEHLLRGRFEFAGLISKSARVPLWALAALLGSLTPSMANISRPIRPCRSHR
ncbi:hypothetical protein [Chitinivorax sp. B]|uniref:hypothetical protein n=1 Tax=Chitinivorax sp. B TaxID=2502235 RepID=UPI0014850DF7|nr:hypothetical protein [Chitinivorax sp. B]